MIKVLVAIRVPGIDVHEVIQNHRRRVVELMQEWTRIKRDVDAADVSLTLVVDSELFRLDSVIRWLDAADGRLRRATVEAAPVPGRPAAGEASGEPVVTPAPKRRVGMRR